MEDDVKHRRALQALGQRAVDYYLDTGLCVFCGADDCSGVPHDDHCNVGTLAGVPVDAQRIAEKSRQRALVHFMIHGLRPTR